MHRVILGTTRPAALVVAIALLSPLTCFAGPEMTPTQEACCAAMGHECDSMTQQDCCSTEVRQVDPSAVTKKVTVSAHVDGASSTATVEPIVAISLAVRLRIAADVSHRPRSAPTYLLVSALLI